MRLYIQPSYGNKAAREHWRDILANEVDFRTPRRWQSLRSSERERLDQLHPGGRARFWGAQSGQDTKFDGANTGDVVLFTGLSYVRGVGEMGAVFRNRDFADTLWTPDPDKGSWHNVYSLLTFHDTRIPYADLQQQLGTSERDNFMGLRVIADEDRAAAALDGLGISTATADQTELDRLTAVSLQLSGQLGHDQLVPSEALNTTTTMWIQQARTITARRAELALVKLWESSLPAEADIRRIRCLGMVVDSYVSYRDTHDLVEAKARSTHKYVRDALGQLLDYVDASTSRVTSLTALFPDRPSNRDVALLHRYGIDCLHRTHNGTFAREPATAAARDLWAAGRRIQHGPRETSAGP